jgi:hypothetical protein
MAINHKVTIVVNSALYLVAGNDEIIMINTPGPATVLLPSTDAGNINRRVLYIKDYSGQADANPITIKSAGGKTIDGDSAVTLNSGYAYVQVVHDGANWKIISQSYQSGGNKKKKLKDYFKMFSIR